MWVVSSLHNLDAFAERFAGWGIPYPAFNAVLSAYTECIGGALTIIGLFTRLVSIPMMISMRVAIVKVRLKTVGSVDDFVKLNEPLYLLCFLWLMIVGAAASAWTPPEEGPLWMSPPSAEGRGAGRRGHGEEMAVPKQVCGPNARRPQIAARAYEATLVQSCLRGA